MEPDNLEKSLIRLEGKVDQLTEQLDWLREMYSSWKASRETIEVDHEKRLQELESYVPLRNRLTQQLNGNSDRINELEKFRDRVWGLLIGSGLLSGSIVGAVVKLLS